MKNVKDLFLLGIGLVLLAGVSAGNVLLDCFRIPETDDGWESAQ